MREICDRCGGAGEDQRTLWMACFYAMGELNVPFEEASIHGVCCEKIGTKKLEIINQEIPVFSEPKGKPEHHGLYTLRVCKRCRAEWMSAIESWFCSLPGGSDADADEPQGEAINSGIFIRENGMTKEITREAWDRLHPNEEPVIFKKAGGK